VRRVSFPCSRCSPRAAKDRTPLARSSALVQVSSLATRRGARGASTKALADSGFVRDVNVTFLEAQPRRATSRRCRSSCATFVQQGRHRRSRQLSSIATQTAMKVITDRPIVFGAVANPLRHQRRHEPQPTTRPNVTGARDPAPRRLGVRHRAHCIPKAGAWGTLFDPRRSLRRVLSRDGEAEGAADGHPVRHGCLHEPPGHRLGRAGASRARAPAGSCRSRAS
jgi:hypothetical protein